MKKITFLFFSFLMFVNTSFAQQVSIYSFSESTGSYSAVNGTDITAIGDDGSQNALPIGFTFNYDGVNYTTFSVNTNGFIRLGADIGSLPWTNSMSNASTQSPLIAPFWDDDNRGSGSIQYSLTGASPNQVLEIGWDNVNIGGSGTSSTTAFASFKIVLHQTTNAIEFIYGSTLDAAGTLSASIGLNGANSFLSVTPGSGATTSNSTANNTINSTSSLLGVKYTFLPPPPCSGAPAPGDTISPFSSICIGVPFDLTLQNTTTGSGVSYQWLSSSNGVIYANAPGNSTSATYTATQSIVTFYKCLVTCATSGITIASNFVMVDLNDPLTCYCTPIYTTGIIAGDMISNIEIVGTNLSNNSGTDTTGPSYTYYTGQPNYSANLQAGSNYNVTVTVGTFGGQNVAVWIDYNDDGVFDTTERVGYSTTSISSNGSATFEIVLSCSPSLGVHRMRVRDVWNTSGINIDPCSSYGYGETEDYDVTITQAAPCPQPSALAVSNVTTTTADLSWNMGCSETMWDVHVTLAGGGAPAGVPSDVNAVSPYTIGNLNPQTTYDFYVRSNCQGDGYSYWTGPFTFTTNALPPVNDECISATVLTLGGVFGDNSVIGTNAAATDSNPPAPGCASFNGGDVWYQVVVPASGSLTIETNNDAVNGSTLMDTGMSVYSGGCGNLFLEACDDDSSTDGNFSLITLTGLNPGATLSVDVWGYSNAVMGTFKISAYDASLANADFSTSNFTFYPNPVKDVLNISNTQNISKVQVINLLGQELIVKVMNENQGQIDMSGLSAGTYLVKITSDNQVKTIKVIKE